MFQEAFLEGHRVIDVREESRLAQLAYCFLGGFPKSRCEGFSKKTH